MSPTDPSAQLVQRTNVLKFMTLRSPQSVEPLAYKTGYIEDDEVPRQPLNMAAAADAHHRSVTDIVVNGAFCTTASPAEIVADVIATLPTVGVDCEAVRHGKGEEALRKLERGTLFPDGVYRLLPLTADSVLDPDLARRLDSAWTLLNAAANDKDFDLSVTTAAVAAVFDAKSLVDVAFDQGKRAGWLSATRRHLFDALYTLYVARRLVTVDLDGIMIPLATVHAVEWLATQQFITDSGGTTDTLTTDGLLLLSNLRARLSQAFPLGLAVNGGAKIVVTNQDLARLLKALPVINPVYANLGRPRGGTTPPALGVLGLRRARGVLPFSLGDLKVVKQWLVEYLAGEISHVATILKGETNDRTTRNLDKSNLDFTYSNDRTEEATKDTQTTGRNELKLEIDSVVKSDLQAKADASFTYHSDKITTGVNGGFAYSSSKEDSQKVAQQFAREVVEKAVSNITSRVTEQRSIRRQIESEETVTHSLTNTEDGASHINGFYRYLNKHYKAQVYNYGARNMYEFIIPEPAAFLVEARLRAFEGNLQTPMQPVKPKWEFAKLDFTAAQIDRTLWLKLCTRYDLSALPPYPDGKEEVVLVDPKTNDSLLTEYVQAGYAERRWWSREYQMSIDRPGYAVSKLRLTGTISFLHSFSAADLPKVGIRDRNFVTLWLEGHEGDRPDLSFDTYHWVPDANWNGTLDLSGTPIPLLGSTIRFTIGFQNIKDYQLTAVVELTPSADTVDEWKAMVFRTVVAREQEILDVRNHEMEIQYEAELADFKRQLLDLKGTVVNQMLQGGSGLENVQTIETELRRLCLAELTGEFDADRSDDGVSNIEAVGEWKMDFQFPRFEVTMETVEVEGNPRVPARFRKETGRVLASFESSERPALYPATKLSEAWHKGRHIQFLEQAFEWDQLAYIFYPYFWATPPKWVELLDREDAADPLYTSFLRAGSVRVLVAVEPKYEAAVDYYLRTGEPWFGGRIPLIADPLFVSLYDEIREQQDDLNGAKPEETHWDFLLPTNLVYLDGGDPIPEMPSGAFIN